MAVESRFVVVRHGVEAKTFMDKKSADEYDKMLDMADNLAEVFAQSPVELSEGVVEELSIYLAQRREDLLVALLAKKGKISQQKSVETTAEQDVELVEKKPTKAAKATSTTKTTSTAKVAKAKTKVADKVA